MNIQPGGSVNRRPIPKQQCRQWLGKMWFWSKIILYLIAFAGILNTNIWLRQQTAATEREIRRVEREISGVRRELENLRIRYARLSTWEHIRERIAYFGLKLRDPEPGQVRPITFLTPAQAARTSCSPLPEYRTAVAVPARKPRR